MLWEHSICSSCSGNINIKENYHLDIVQFLFENNYDGVYEKDESGNNGLKLALMNDEFPIIVYLLEHGFEADETDSLECRCVQTGIRVQIMEIIPEISVPNVQSSENSCESFHKNA